MNQGEQKPKCNNFLTQSIEPKNSPHSSKEEETKQSNSEPSELPPNSEDQSDLLNISQDNPNTLEEVLPLIILGIDLPS
jgi:hypothetical protein